MRILHVTYPYISLPPKGYGGSERVASQIVEELVKRGHEVHLLATGDSTTKAELDFIYDKQLTLANFSPYYNIKQYLFARELAKCYRIDVIHNHMGEFGYNVMYKNTTITTMHNDYNVRKRICVAISKNQAQRLRLNKVVYNAIETDKYIYSDKKDKFMLFLGNCIPEKGVEVAIQLAKDLHYPLVMCLKIDKGTGIEKYYNNTIKPMLKGTDKLITIKGIVSLEEKLKLYSKAKVFLMPISWNEPFGLVMLEAMASGTPVVAYNRGSVAEIINDGRSGYIIGGENYYSFKEYVGRILYDNLSLISSTNCLKQAKKFSVEKMVDGYEKIYKEMLKK